MHKRIRLAVAAVAVVGGFALTQAGTASAAHCVEGDSPGFSYFGREGREETGARDASACRSDTGSPSKRAPGQNKD